VSLLTDRGRHWLISVIVVNLARLVGIDKLPATTSILQQQIVPYYFNCPLAQRRRL